MPPDANSIAIMILLAICMVLLFLLLLLFMGLRGRLVRIERLVASREEASPESATASEPVAEATPGGPFEEFLTEDPARRLLSKKEQSAAYRKWRQAKGMNWSNS